MFFGETDKIEEIHKVSMSWDSAGDRGVDLQPIGIDAETVMKTEGLDGVARSPCEAAMTATAAGDGDATFTPPGPPSQRHASSSSRRSPPLVVQDISVEEGITNIDMPIVVDHCGSASPVASSARHDTTKSATCWTSSYLPMFTDKVRSNVRSRFVLVGVYAVCTAFVCLLLVYAFSSTSAPQWEGRFATAPSSTMYIGEPAPRFSFEILNGNTARGVRGLEVFASMSPLKESGLVVTVQDQGTFVTRTLRCVRDLTLTLSATYADDLAFCDPAAYGLIRQSQSITNSFGIATFDNFTVGFGVRGSYVLTVGLLANPSIYVTQLVTLTTSSSSTPTIDVRRGIPFSSLQGLGDGQPAKMFVPILDDAPPNSVINESSSSSTTVVTATITFVPSSRFIAYHAFSASAAAGTAAAEATAAFLGISIEDYVASVYSSVTPLLPLVCGSIIAIESPQQRVANHYGCSPPKAQRFVNNFACTSTLVPTGNTTPTTPTEFTATLTFPNFAITSSNTDDMYFGLAAMGQIVPLPVESAFTSSAARNAQRPSQLIIGATPQTSVYSAVASCVGCEEAQWVVQERSVVGAGTLTVAVRSRNGQPLPNKLVYVSIEGAVAGGQTATSTSSALKQLLFDTSVTNAAGEAVFEKLQFSTTGQPGQHYLSAVCDGVRAVWRAASAAGSSGAQLIKRQAVTVTTSVAFVSVINTVRSPLTSSSSSAPVELASPAEVVGESWNTLPVFHVTGTDGVGISGKTVTIDVRSTSSDGEMPTSTGTKSLSNNIIAESLPADQSGIVLMTSVIVQTLNVSSWANLSSPSTQGAPQRVVFAVLVDGTEFGTFVRWMSPPRNYTWVVAPLLHRHDLAARTYVKAEVGVTHDTQAVALRATWTQVELASMLEVPEVQLNGTHVRAQFPSSRRHRADPRLRIVSASRKSSAPDGRPAIHPQRRNVGAPLSVAPSSLYGSCACVRVLNQQPLDGGYFGVPFFMRGVALDALGNRVGLNTSVTLTFSSTPVDVNTSAIRSDDNATTTSSTSRNATQTFLTEDDGTFAFWLEMILDGMWTSIHGVTVAGTLQCTTTSHSVSVFDVTFRSRVMAAENATFRLTNSSANVSHQSICARLRLRNETAPYLVTKSSPVVVTVVPRWYPEYVVAFLSPDRIPSMPPLVIEDAADIIHSEVCIPVPSTFPPGLYGFGISCDSVLMEPLLIAPTTATSPLTSHNVSLSVNRSVFSTSIDTSLGVGVPLQRQPIVQVSASGTDTPLAGVAVFIQLAAIVVGTTNRTYQNVNHAAMDLSMGAIGIVVNATNSSSSSGGVSVHKPVSYFSDLDGLARFHDLQIVSVPVGIPFSVRYCVSINLIYSISIEGGGDDDSICVDDPNVGIIPLSQVTSFTTSLSSISASPGQPLPSITIRASIANGVAAVPPVVVCAPTLFRIGLSSGRPTAGGLLEFPSDSSDVPSESLVSAYGSFVDAGGSGELTISGGGIYLSPTIEDGSYVLQFVCAGGLPLPMVLTVSSTPASIAITVPPPDVVQLNTAVVVQAQLLSQSGSPIPSTDMELTIQSQTPLSNCTGRACGYLDTSSLLFATTNDRGEATFSFTFTAGNTSTFSLVFHMAASSTALLASPAAYVTRQAPRAQLTLLSELFGVPSMSLVSLLLSKRVPLLNIASLSAGLDSRGLGTVVVGGAAVETPSSSLPTTSADSDAGDATVSTDYVNPLETLVVLLKTGVVSALAASTTGLTAFATVSLANPVTRGEFMRPMAALQLVLPPHIDAVPTDVLTANGAVTAAELTEAASVALDASTAPLIQFFLADGTTPAANHTVIVEVLPVNDFDCVVSYTKGGGGGGGSSPSLTTDANGTVLLSSITITAFTVGSYQLQISAEGGGAVSTDPFVVTQRTPVSRKDAMQYLALVLVCFFSPMLLASVPHSRQGYLPVGCVVSIIAAALTWSLVRDLVPDDVNQPLYRGYYYFLACLTTVVAAATLVVACVERLSKRAAPKEGSTKWYQLRLFDDERRAEEVLRYVTWITNVRVRHQAAQWEAYQQELIHSVGARVDRWMDVTMLNMSRAIKRAVKRAKCSKSDDGETTSSTAAESSDDDEDDRQVELHIAQSLIPATQTGLFYGPSETFDAVYLPINFLIVIGISTVILVTLCFIVSFIFSYVYRKLNLLMSYLPNTSGADGNQLAIANKALILSITTVVDTLVRLFPTLAPLASINSGISDIDIVQILGNIRTFVDGGLIRFEVAFWVAGTVASVGFVITQVLTWMTIPNTIRQIRRGNKKITSTVNSIEAYIGMHCLQLVIMHQLVFWILAVVIFLLSIHAIRSWIWDQLSVIIIASLSLYLTQTLVIELVVSKFLSDGRWLVVRPELYSIWHFIGLILGIFAGLMKSVVRVAMALGFVILLFARLDQAIYPELFASMDKGHHGFLSVVNVEAKTGNPIYIVFCTLLLLEKKLRDTAAQVAATAVAEGCELSSMLPTTQTSCSSAQQQGFNAPVLPVDDTVFLDDYNLSSVVKSVAMLVLRRDAGCPTQLNQPPIVKGSKSTSSCPAISLAPFVDLPSRIRQVRVQQRLWLYVVMSANPSLVLLRKHHLRQQHENVNAPAATAAEPTLQDFASQLEKR